MLGLLTGPYSWLAPNVRQILVWSWFFLAFFQILHASKHYCVLCSFSTLISEVTTFKFCLDLRNFEHFPVARMVNLYGNRSANAGLQTAGFPLLPVAYSLEVTNKTATVPVKTIAQVTSYALVMDTDACFKSFVSKSY